MGIDIHFRFITIVIISNGRILAVAQDSRCEFFLVGRVIGVIERSSPLDIKWQGIT